MHTKRAFSKTVFIALYFFSTVTMAATPPLPCDSAANKQFDFWVGDWEVRVATGKLAGYNRIEKKHAGCVLHEQYSTPTGYTGESFNIYDAGRKVWHQTWVDNTGTLLVLEGGLKDGSMVLSGETIDEKAVVTKHRITWTPNADASVRQHWESTDASGKWITAFDGKYTRKPAG